MKAYSAEQIRNIAILGHSSSGKTTLAEALLYRAKVTERQGRVSDGNTVMDFDPEEIRRGISINTSLASFEWKGKKVNLLDTPGDFDFMGEAVSALSAADASIIVVGAKEGLTVGTEKSMRYSRTRSKPYAFLISKLDEPNADYDKALASLQAYATMSVIPFMLPVMQGGRMTGFVDTIHRIPYELDAQGKGQRVETIPPEIESRLDAVHEQLREHIAETSELLMDKFFNDEPFTEEEFHSGLYEAVRQAQIRPVFCCSATETWGMEYAFDQILDYLPSPADRFLIEAEYPDGEVRELPLDPSGPVALRVFKTLVDPFVGKISLFKVYSGTLKAGLSLYNSSQDKEERITGIYTLLGKKTINLDSIQAGDIGALTKLGPTVTGDTLCQKEKSLVLPRPEFPVPCFSMAIQPTKKGEEDKIMSGLQRLREEDPTFTVVNNSETHQMVVSGLGAQQIDVLRAKLQAKYKVESTLAEPRVPYRETIRKKVKVQGKHKKQSGGHGQYGDVWVEFEPNRENPDAENLVFEQKIFGGSVPKSYHPAVEKGLQEAIEKGPLAGYPVVGLKATLVDGSYHDVDSSEMAFKLAAHLAYKAGLPQASPVLLEPISEVKVYVPEAQLGDIMSDINQRRGRIMGVDPKGEVHLVEAEIPSSEMASYATDLRSMTQGRGWFGVQFARYEQAPQPVADRVIKERQESEE